MLRIFFRLLILIAAPLLISAAGKADLHVDLVAAVPQATVTNALQFAVRRPGESGGVKVDSLFLHPVHPDAPAQITYPIHLPAINPGDRLFLAFQIGIADGVKTDPPMDGVTFTILTNGSTAFRETSAETRWRARCLDFTALGGQAIQLTFQSHAGANTAYDWALWGAPRIVVLRDGPVITSTTTELPISSGFFAAQLRQGEEVKLNTPSGENVVLKADLAGWHATDFLFTNASTFRIEAPPSVTNTFIGQYSPMLGLVNAGPIASIVEAGASRTIQLGAILRNSGKGISPAGEALLELNGTKQAVTLPRLLPGKEASLIWETPLPQRAGRNTFALEALTSEARARWTNSFEVFPKGGKTTHVSSREMSVTFRRAENGYAYAEIHGADDRSKPLAYWTPLFRLVTGIGDAAHEWQIRPASIQSSRSAARVSASARDADGVQWHVTLDLGITGAVAQVRQTWRADADRDVYALWGADLKVADERNSLARVGGLFPGLEQLYLDEASSNLRDLAPPMNDRRSPHPFKLTAPFMALSVAPASGPYTSQEQDFFYTPDALLSAPAAAKFAEGVKLQRTQTLWIDWNPLQKWDGVHHFPTPRFVSPNIDDGQRNHRLALFLPSVPEQIDENGVQAKRPYKLKRGQTLTLDYSFGISRASALGAFGEWCRRTRALETAPQWPRSFEEQLQICREGFLKTLWDPKAQQWSHCIGWPSSDAPGFATLLWTDSTVTTNVAAAKTSRDRVELVARKMINGSGPAALTSQANCHILQWEFPFHYGHLPEAMRAIDAQVRDLVGSQHPDGGWRYAPANKEQASLGRLGDSVLGTSAQKSSVIARYARITGDLQTLAAAEKTLLFMERFRVPRGGQTWECPMYEPDILAAAYAMRAYLEAYRASGNQRWLHNAIYWAETGMHFQYLWHLADKPMMRGASIPVYGSTFYTHSWLSTPVQWCGLVYAYQLLHLIPHLQDYNEHGGGSELQLQTTFRAQDYRAMAELIIASAAHQQFASGDKIGAYPDSISNFETPNPAFINPEDIMLNLFALRGADPDIQTARFGVEGERLVISSGASIVSAHAEGRGVILRLSSRSTEPTHGFVAGPKPRSIEVNGQRLPQATTQLTREPGWTYDEHTKRAYFVIPGPTATATFVW